MFLPLLILGCGAGPEAPPPTEPVPAPTTAERYSPPSWRPDRVFSPPFSLSGSLAETDDHQLNAGRMRSADATLRVPVRWQPGRHELSVRARMEGFDDTPGELEVRLGQRAIGVLTFPRAIPTVATLELDVAGGHDAIDLRFMNWAHDAGSGFGRELRIERVDVARIDPVPPNLRAERLRAALQGSNVVLVSIDTLRADHLGVYGYRRDTSPNIDRLAQRGTAFDYAIASSHWTAPAHASLLTGLHPPEHGVTSFPHPQRMAAEIDTAAELFARGGYESVWFSGGGYVSEALGMAQGAEVVDEAGRPAEERFARVTKWLKERDDNRPFFAFVHSYQPHDPYDPPEGFDLWAPSAAEWLREPFHETMHKGRTVTAVEHEALVGLYDGEIRYTDAALGSLLVALDEAGHGDDTLVILTSDHGEEFLEYGHFGHSKLREKLLHVPLVFSHPALPSLVQPRVHSLASTIDVLPTTLDLVGLPIPEEMSGTSRVDQLVGLGVSDTAFAATEMHGSTEAAVQQSGMLSSGGNREVYYERDGKLPGKERLPSLPEAAELRERLKRWRVTSRLRAPTESPVLSDERRQQLEALGYVASDLDTGSTIRKERR